MEDKIIYAALFVGVLVAAWAGLGAIGIGDPPSGPELGAGGRVAQSAQSRQYYAQLAKQAGSECGDLNDPQNLQHLSHHPSQFQACYKVVDPAKFKAAVGKDVSEFIAQGGSSGQGSMAGHHG